jgi:hypothetical protein
MRPGPALPPPLISCALRVQLYQFCSPHFMILGNLTHLFELGNPNNVQVEVELCNKKIEETREI